MPNARMTVAAVSISETGCLISYPALIPGPAAIQGMVMSSDIEVPWVWAWPPWLAVTMNVVRSKSPRSLNPLVRLPIPRSTSSTAFK